MATIVTTDGSHIIVHDDIQALWHELQRGKKMIDVHEVKSHTRNIIMVDQIIRIY